jgi:hypothetical protein
MMARSFGVFELLFHKLRYEGHPALWYLVLWVPAHLHVPYVAINWISSIFGCASIYILLRHSPFPIYLKALLPFGFWLTYEYSVVGRSYCLFPLLGFTAAHLYRKSPGRPVAMAVTLALLANVSIHGSIVAFGLGIAYSIKVLRNHPLCEWPAQQRRALFSAAGLFAASLVLVAVCIWPPNDLRLPFSPTVTHALHRIFSHRTHTATSYFYRPAFKTAAWFPESTGSVHAVASPAARERLAVRVRFIFGYPVTSFYPLALLLEAWIVLFLATRRRLELILPYLLLAGFLGTVYSRVWHVGLLWVTLAIIMWAAWDERERWHWRSIQGQLVIIFGLVAALQIPWTIGAIQYERHHLTYPAEATAKYLKTLPPGERIDGNGLMFTVYPYFERGIFIDHKDGRFDHNSLYPLDEKIEDMIALQADVILSRNGLLTRENLKDMASSGYRETHRFCGEQYFPDGPVPEPMCFVVYQKQ